MRPAAAARYAWRRVPQRTVGGIAGNPSVRCSTTTESRSNGRITLSAHSAITLSVAWRWLRPSHAGSAKLIARLPSE